MFGVPDLTLKEFKGARRGELHHCLQEEARKMALPLNRHPLEPKKGVLARALSILLRSLRKISLRLRLT